MKLRWIISALVLLIMIYSVISQKELYPFAPYNMYSTPNYRPQLIKEVRIFFGNNPENLTEITSANQNLIYPFDEARVKMSLENEKYRSGGLLDSPSVRKKAIELLVTINRNSGEKYKLISVGIYTYKDIADLRAGNKTMIEQINEKIE